MCQRSAVPGARTVADSLSPYAATGNASQHMPWRLPETGLAVFHGHPDVPRLFHYFLPRLVMQGQPVLCLDGANRFDPLLLARFAREREVEPGIFNQRVRVSRDSPAESMSEYGHWLPKTSIPYDAAHGK